MERRGPWSKEETDRYLEQTRVPIRLACNGASGHPLLLSLWFAPLDGLLWCATQESARVVELLRRDPRCAFEVAGETQPYFGVRGQGEARVDRGRGEPVLRTLIGRYLPGPETDFARWLLERADSEVAISIAPARMVSWDFRERMASND